MRWPFAILLLFAPLPVRAADPPRDPRAERQTLGGLSLRLSERLSWIDREADLRRQNVGLAGRRNATIDAARAAEQPSQPSLLPRTLSGY